MRAVYKTRETTGGGKEGGEGWKIETGRLVTLPRFRELIHKMIKLFEFSLFPGENDSFLPLGK